jgi:hypothetical protein
MDAVLLCLPDPSVSRPGGVMGQLGHATILATNAKPPTPESARSDLF